VTVTSCGSSAAFMTSCRPRDPLIVYEDGDPAAAVQAALCGTLCVVLGRQANVIAVVDLAHAVAYAERPSWSCAQTTRAARQPSRGTSTAAMIALPRLPLRSNEVERIAHESAADIAKDLGAPGPGSACTTGTATGVKFDSIEAIEETVRRIVVMRTWGVTAVQRSSASITAHSRPGAGAGSCRRDASMGQRCSRIIPHRRLQDADRGAGRSRLPAEQSASCARSPSTSRSCRRRRTQTSGFQAILHRRATSASDGLTCPFSISEMNLALTRARFATTSW